MTGEGVDARQIGQMNRMFACGDGSFRKTDGFSRPVAGMLVHSGEGVEHGAFPDVGVSGKGGGNGHPRTPVRTETIPASRRRRAITAPRTR